MDTSSGDAKLDSGVLTVTIGKSEESTPRKIG